MMSSLITLHYFSELANVGPKIRHDLESFNPQQNFMQMVDEVWDKKKG